jgi:hypothetical protein
MTNMSQEPKMSQDENQRLDMTLLQQNFANSLRQAMGEAQPTVGEVY